MSLLSPLSPLLSSLSLSLSLSSSSPPIPLPPGAFKAFVSRTVSPFLPRMDSADGDDKTVSVV